MLKLIHLHSSPPCYIMFLYLYVLFFVWRACTGILRSEGKYSKSTAVGKWCSCKHTPLSLMRSCWKCIIKLENVLYHIVVRLWKELIPRNVCTLAFPFAAPVLCGNDVIMHLCVSHWPGRTEQNWKGKQDSQSRVYIAKNQNEVC